MVSLHRCVPFWSTGWWKCKSVLSCTMRLFTLASNFSIIFLRGTQSKKMNFSLLVQQLSSSLLKLRYVRDFTDPLRIAILAKLYSQFLIIYLHYSYLAKQYRKGINDVFSNKQSSSCFLLPLFQTEVKTFEYESELIASE